MSRLDAALRRAQTGVVVPAPLPESPLSPAVESPASAAPEEAPSEGGALAAEAPARTSAGRSKTFTGFHPDHLEKLVISPSIPQPLRETYRRLAATLHGEQAEHGIKVLMVSSAVPDEGKTLTATNIALTLSESYERRVLLIDADLRRPSLDTLFSIGRVQGLNEALTSVPPRQVPVIPVSRWLSLLPAGKPDPDPMSSLTSDRMRRLLAEAATHYDWVIIDTPPVGILTDGKLLGAMVDAALLVVRAGKTPSTLVQQAIDALGRNRILGVVLNRTETRHTFGAYSAYGSDYYYGTKR